MKKGILFLLLIAGITVNAQEKKQSLKDLLYGGKLKLDSNSVIRKGDDLNSKIDTSTKKPVQPEKPKTTTVAGDPSVKKPVINNDTMSIETTDVDNTGETAVTTTTAPVKSNSKIWKEYSQSLVSTLTAEVLPSKKIKKETYYISVDHEIGTDGIVTITNVITYPENTFLQAQVKEHIELSPPQLATTVNSSGVPRKVKKKYNFNITKE